jgi:hypothetical protein
MPAPAATIVLELFDNGVDMAVAPIVVVESFSIMASTN